MKIKLKNNKILIFIILFIFLLAILGIITNYKNIESIYNNAFGKNLKNEDEGEFISVDIKVKEIQENMMIKCLLIFTSKDESEKIKSIKYPGEEQNTIIVNDEDGKEKIAVDYEIEMRCKKRILCRNTRWNYVHKRGYN